MLREIKEREQVVCVCLRVPRCNNGSLRSRFGAGGDTQYAVGIWV